MKETIEMGQKLTLEKVLEDAGWIAEWEARGRAETNLEIARKMKADNLPIDQIVKYTGLTKQ
jgi:predicted Rossmann fold nucleotide-binding protein DprA/Smf involved in DNA uptake